MHQRRATPTPAGNTQFGPDSLDTTLCGAAHTRRAYSSSPSNEDRSPSFRPRLQAAEGQHALPIGLPLTLADDDLLFAAEAFRRIGNEFMLRIDIMFQGADEDVRQANAAKLKFESAGIGLQILSAWMKALDVLNGARLCSIC